MHTESNDLAVQSMSNANDLNCRDDKSLTVTGMEVLE